MTEQEKDDLFFVCTMIEYISRRTKNHRHVVVDFIKIRTICGVPMKRGACWHDKGGHGKLF
ncbi:hypothetical protein [uncultured Selenomonas sp.]|uniref:hypothetical protein n=1 Tax=uncultured Selenomonas sp. TaxID=159275 RepID=UPI0025EB8637|nr:hypothetical protein [uncultured Selenomonas sp.]